MDARVAELADALDLGSSEISRGGSNPPSRTIGLESHMAEEWTEGKDKDRKFTVTVSHPSECKRVLSIEIAREEIEKEEARIFEEFRRDLKVPGFRKGKVPVKYIEKNYADVIHGDAVRNLLPSIYEDALVREGIRPVGEPKFEKLKADKGENASVEVEVEVRPDITVKDYVGVKVKVEQREVGDKEVGEALERIREQKTVLVVVDRPVKEGDFVLVDHAPVLESGEVDLKKMTRDHPVDLSSESLLEEFREGLLGMQTKEEKDIEVQYPDDFPGKEVAGKRIRYRVTVKEIKEKTLPDLDDALAKELGEQFTDLEALKSQIKEDLRKEEDKRRQHEIEERIIDRVIESNPFDVPEAMIENYFTSVLEEDRRRRPNVPDETERVREVREHFRGAAVRTIRKFLILEAVRKQENIVVTQEEIGVKIEGISKDGGDGADEIRKYFNHPERRRSIEGELLDNKAIEFLHKNADVEIAR